MGLEGKESFQLSVFLPDPPALERTCWQVTEQSFTALLFSCLLWRFLGITSQLLTLTEVSTLCNYKRACSITKVKMFIVDEEMSISSLEILSRVHKNGSKFGRIVALTDALVRFLLLSTFESHAFFRTVIM